MSWWHYHDDSGGAGGSWSHLAERGAACGEGAAAARVHAGAQALCATKARQGAVAALHASWWCAGDEEPRPRRRSEPPLGSLGPPGGAPARGPGGVAPEERAAALEALRGSSGRTHSSRWQPAGAAAPGYCQKEWCPSAWQSGASWWEGHDGAAPSANAGHCSGASQQHEKRSGWEGEGWRSRGHDASDWGPGAPQEAGWHAAAPWAGRVWASDQQWQPQEAQPQGTQGDRIIEGVGRFVSRKEQQRHRRPIGAAPGPVRGAAEAGAPARVWISAPALRGKETAPPHAASERKEPGDEAVNASDRATILKLADSVQHLLKIHSEVLDRAAAAGHTLPALAAVGSSSSPRPLSPLVTPQPERWANQGRRQQPQPPLCAQYLAAGAELEEAEAQRSAPSHAVGGPHWSGSGAGGALQALGPALLGAAALPLPPGGMASWEWPLSRQEKKVRVTMVDQHMSMLDRQDLAEELDRLRDGGRFGTMSAPSRAGRISCTSSSSLSSATTRATASTAEPFPFETL